MTSFERRGKQFISFLWKFSEIFYVFLWPCPVHHKHKQLDISSPVDNSLICFLFFLICPSALLQTDLLSSLVRPSAMINDRLFSRKPWCCAVGNTAGFVWSRQVKRVVTDALSLIGESWLQPLVVEISWSVLHWFVLLEKNMLVATLAMRERNRTRVTFVKRIFCLAYKLSKLF